MTSPSTTSYSQAGILASDPAYAGTADTPAAGGHVLTVGPGGHFATLAAAIAAANNGDVIAIKGGITLTNDFSYVTKNITIEGVGGMVNMVATVPPPNEKGILVIDGNANVTVKNISFSGVAIPGTEGANGAGIRYDTGNLTVKNCDFHNNQNGILSNPDATGTINIDHSTFENNGSGTGYTHDIYIGEVAKFTLTNSVVASANIGHEVKSRALVSDIENNIIKDGPTGTGSYDIDLPNGGMATVKGNYIEKGPLAQNQTMVHFGGEGIPYVNSSLDIEGNTFVNDRGSSTIALTNSTLTTATVDNNSFANISASRLVSGAATLEGNVDGNGVAIANTTQAALTAGTGVWIFTDSADHSLTFTQAGQDAEGGAGHLTITTTSGHHIVIGGTGGLTYTDTGLPSNEWNDTITTAAGSTNQISVQGGDIINSYGTDTITLGSGNCKLAISGDAQVSGGTASNTFQVTGKLALSIGGGSDWVSVASGASATVSGNAVYYLQGDWSGSNFAYGITENGQSLSASFVGGGGEVKVYNGSANVTLAAGGPGSNVTLGTGKTTVTSVGADIIHAGSGNDTIIVSGNAQIYAGSGQLSVYGRSEHGIATVFGNGGTTLIDGDTGGIRYVGDSQNSTVVENLSHVEIDGGSGHVTITGTGSHRTIIGGSGGIDVVNAYGGDIITTAAGSTNTISLAAASTIYSNGSDAITCGTGNLSLTATGNATITGSHGNCQYTLDGHETLTSYGTDTITVGAGADATDIASGTLANVVDKGGTIHFSEIANGDNVGATVTGIATITAWGGSGALTVKTSGPATSIVLAGGNDTVYSTGADNITTGSGNDHIYASGKGDTIAIAAQNAAHTIVVDGFSAAADKIALGNLTMAGQTLSSTGLVVNLADGATLSVSHQTGFLSAATGQITAAGATSNGGRIFTIAQDAATATTDHDVLNVGFHVGVDQVVIHSSAGNGISAQTLLASATVTADGWTDLHLSSHQDLVLVGVTPGHLTATSLTVV